MRSHLVPLLLIASLTACLDPGDPREVTSADGEVGEAAQATNAFAIDLYQEIAAQEGNLFFSPFSVSAAFGMTLAGTDGDTYDQLATAMHITGDEADFHGGLGALVQDLDGERGRGYTLEVANRLFGQEGYPFQADFLTVTSEDYAAPLEHLDFIADPDGSRGYINGWVEDETHGRIEDLLPAGSITSLTRLVLANAIYFLADWATAFDPEDTYDGSFILADGTEVTTPMMYGEIEAESGWAEGVGVLRLPYADDEVDLVVLVPDAGSDLATLEADLSPDFIDTLLDSTYASEELQVHLPKFEMTLETNLIPVLQGLGVEDAFICGEADFSRLTTPDLAEGLCITGAFHKAFVSVDEAGTEAAAATAVVVGYESEPPNFEVNRPFVFMIRDDLTGSILFMGRVADPR